jgi:hypothetical protein
MYTEPTLDGLADVVVQIAWNRVGVLTQDGKTYTATILGVLNCTPPDPISFVPYQDLTFQDVCDWLDQSYDLDELNTRIDKQIAGQMVTEPVVLPNPWD